MRIFFSGIGGTGIGPLALIAKQAGYDVCGSDAQASTYTKYLGKKGVSIVIGQTDADIAAVHAKTPIDWLVRSSAIPKESPELKFARKNRIKITKRGDLINKIISDKGLKLVAVAGTHGKTTTTAMVVWLFKELGIPVSYSVGAKISYGEMGEFVEGSEYFVLEADEFDRNFLSFHPYLSLITGVSWDHHEIFPTKGDYQQAFRDFVNQTNQIILWEHEYDYLKLKLSKNYAVLSPHGMPKIDLPGEPIRQDAWLAVQALATLTKTPADELISLINKFPGLQRRMEEITPGLYTDYAHTPEKIKGAMSVALDTAGTKNVVVVYEPLTNRRQHYMAGNYRNCFAGASAVYWIPSYLAREDPKQRVIEPDELISNLADPGLAQAMERDKELKRVIQKHLDKGDMVVAMAGGGGGSLDEWLRKEFKTK